MNFAATSGIQPTLAADPLTDLDSMASILDLDLHRASTMPQMLEANDVFHRSVCKAAAAPDEPRSGLCAQFRPAAAGVRLVGHPHLLLIKALRQHDAALTREAALMIYDGKHQRAWSRRPHKFTSA